ncbi:D-alanyl-D-alanine carboxypeptidase (penicillin-binding protein 5/6) [Butyrivibrio proteoclasticus]|uniref:D-alanyl-D-alanine carboxypeptidase (Penicillin-binding protein 5/6) n=1 Tax=Butyrivibrio proteoclasticus TaxID=43305 RepID=A0A1I5TVD1_9FIRM|nr:D-alanyl-D-alanine carboxypeptidase family protein [Butyrivibrio proteoclasticus]SFP87025.1 D-alanyl-D-alanine carboxypeptidase (penicillin-binding protein 5/6) [Butyrivibrio proteoclasticus]
MDNLFNRKKHNFIYKTFLCTTAFLIMVTSLPVRADAETVDYAALAQERKALPIQSNDIANWPEGPEVSAESAIVMEAETGTILYAKNIHEELYPASTTKIMTCLLAVENASLNDNITFSHDAVFSVPNDGSSIGMDVGESITLEQALYGIMVGSANEVANAVAEHVSGSIDDFVTLMNDRAKELGCTNTHFANTNGLQNDNHYTSVYDLALISKEFFNNDLLCKVGNTPRYHFEPTSTQPDDFYLNNKHKLITGEIAYEGIVGGKTGYTDQARETLVTCAEKNGMKLVCVVFKEESPTQFTDTVTLFDYAFNNFHLVNVANEETRYMPDDSLFFESDHDVFGKSGTILKLDDSSVIVLPKTSQISEADYEVTYDLSDEERAKYPTGIAKVNYTYHDVGIGNAMICYSLSVSESSAETNTPTIRPFYINVKILFIVAAVFVIIMTIIGTSSSKTVRSRKGISKSDRVRYNRRKREFNKSSKKFKF